MIFTIRRMTISICVYGLIVAMTGCAATQPAQSTAATAHPKHGVAREPIVRAINFRATPLDQVMEELRRQTGANIVVNWRSLEADGLEKTIPITLRLSNVPLMTVLKQVGDIAGGGTLRLDVCADDGILTFDTQDALSVRMRTKVYDLRDLIPAARGDDALKSLVNFINDQTKEQGCFGPVYHAQCILFDGRLIVVGTPEAQAFVTDLLDGLRRN